MIVITQHRNLVMLCNIAAALRVILTVPIEVTARPIINGVVNYQPLDYYPPQPEEGSTNEPLYAICVDDDLFQDDRYPDDAMQKAIDKVIEGMTTIHDMINDN